jgi:hypothetical protein
LTLKATLLSRPVIYEIVPPRRDVSRFSTELRGVDEVLEESRIAAINIPELIKRRSDRGGVVYSPATIPPEDYAMMIRDRKEPVVNLIAPRMDSDSLLRRVRKILDDYKIHNLILVGRERREDRLPGPDVVEALRMVSKIKGDAALGGICIFSRESKGKGEGGKVRFMPEAERVWLKARAGCDFVTSQICFEAGPVVSFLAAYQELCEKTKADPITIFVSFTTVPSKSILALLGSLDVDVPDAIVKRLLQSSEMGKDSVRVAIDVFRQILSGAERKGIKVPLGLQIEQVGVNNGDLSLRLLDGAYPLLHGG